MGCPIPTRSEVFGIGIGVGVGIGWRGPALALLGVGNAMALVAGSGGAPVEQLAAVWLAAGLGGAAVLWVACDGRFERVPVAAVLGLALVLRLISGCASPLLEDDHYRYLWDGLRTAIALDPYSLPPAAYFGATELSARWHDILSGINNPDIPTLYGPLLQGLFALAHVIAPGQVGGVQALLLIVDMAVLALLAAQRVNPRLLLIYAVHPLVLKEAMASAHPDGLVALWLLLALVAWRRQRAACVGAMLGLAVGTKVAALVVLPLLLLAPTTFTIGNPGRHWAPRVMLAAAATLALLYLPFVWARGSDAAGLLAFGSQWRFNPLLYRLLEALLPPAAARPAAALLIGAGVCLLAWQWRRGRDAEAAPPLHSALALLILLAPVVNPWYWLWALALSIAAHRLSVAAVGVVAVVSYVNSTVLGLSEGLPYTVAWPLAVLQVVVFGVAAWWERARPKTSTPRGQ